MSRMAGVRSCVKLDRLFRAASAARSSYWMEIILNLGARPKSRFTGVVIPTLIGNKAAGIGPTRYIHPERLYLRGGQRPYAAATAESVGWINGIPDGIVSRENLAVEIAVAQAGGTVEDGYVLPKRARVYGLRLASVAAGGVGGRDICTEDCGDPVRRSE